MFSHGELGIDFISFNQYQLTPHDVVLLSELKTFETDLRFDTPMFENKNKKLGKQVENVDIESAEYVDSFLYAGKRVTGTS